MTAVTQRRSNSLGSLSISLSNGTNATGKDITMKQELGISSDDMEELEEMDHLIAVVLQEIENTQEGDATTSQPEDLATFISNCSSNSMDSQISVPPIPDADGIQIHSNNNMSSLKDELSRSSSAEKHAQFQVSHKFPSNIFRNPFRKISPNNPFLITKSQSATFRKKTKKPRKAKKLVSNPYITAILELRQILTEVDDNRDGRIDFNEFCEAINGIFAKPQTHTHLESIFKQIVWEEVEDSQQSNELHISSFIELVRYRNIDDIDACQQLLNAVHANETNSTAIPAIEVTPNDLLSKAFFDSVNTCISSEDIIVESGMDRILRILTEVNESNNGKIDVVEFKDAMDTLGVQFGAETLEIVYARFVAKQLKAQAQECLQMQSKIDVKLTRIDSTTIDAESKYNCMDINDNMSNNNTNKKDDRKECLPPKITITKRQVKHTELIINDFMKLLKTIGNYESLEAAQILKRAILPIANRNRRKIEQQMKRRKFQMRGRVMSSDCIHRFQSKKIRKAKSRPNVLGIRNSWIQPQTQQFWRSVSPKVNRSPKSSIMTRENSSVIVIPALKKCMKDVDDDCNGTIDFDEFFEVMELLKSDLSLHRMRASRIFYAMADVKTHELDLDSFMKEMQLTYEMNPKISGDACLQRLAQKYSTYRFGHSSHASNNSSASGSGSYHRENNVMINKVKEEFAAVHPRNGNNTLDKEEFLDFLNSFNVKLGDDEFEAIWYHLTMNESELVLIDSGDEYTYSDTETVCVHPTSNLNEMSINLFMHYLYQVNSDHPSYVADRAVNRVCRRIFKMSRNKH